MKAVFDIETSFGLFYSYAHNMYEAQLSREYQSIRLLTVSVKPLGGRVRNFSSIDYPNYKAFLKDVKNEVFDKYDVLIAHNGKKFDLKQCNTFFAEVGLPKCKKFPKNMIDTLSESRREFNLPSHSLKFLLRHFKIGINKMETGGEDLWFQCMTSNKDGSPTFPAAWRKMIRYCNRDVVATEMLYSFLLGGGWIKSDPENSRHVPNMLCPRCKKTRKWAKRGIKPVDGIGYQYYGCVKCNKQLPGEVVDSW